MTDIVTITLNPAIDKTYVISDLLPEHKLRCANPLVEAGGGGINVSKGLKEMGSSSVSVFFAGGRNGEHLLEMLMHQQIECKPIPIDGETRESLVIMDQSSEKEFRLVVDGPRIDVSAFQEIIQFVHTVKPSYLIASGSLPQGLSKDVYALLAREAKIIGSKFILDTSGEALEKGLQEGVYLMKPNLKELSNLTGVESLRLDEIPDAALTLIEAGKAEIVVVSMSAAGAMLVTKEMHHHILTPKVEQKSTVGAGDSMVGGMVWALQQNKNLLEMACWGVACGAAATINNSAQLFKKEDAIKLFDQIREKSNL